MHAMFVILWDACVALWSEIWQNMHVLKENHGNELTYRARKVYFGCISANKLHCNWLLNESTMPVAARQL